MKPAIPALLTAVTLSSCVTQPYYGKSVVEERGQLVCGLHRIPVEAHHGYIFDGLISFIDEESMNFGTARFPNTLGVGFRPEKSKDFSLPVTDYTCTKCLKGYRKLEKLPMWYKRIVGLPAEMRRERRLEGKTSEADAAGSPVKANSHGNNGSLLHPPKQKQNTTVVDNRLPAGVEMILLTTTLSPVVEWRAR